MKLSDPRLIEDFLTSSNENERNLAATVKAVCEHLSHVEKCSECHGRGCGLCRGSGGRHQGWRSALEYAC